MSKSSSSKNSNPSNTLSPRSHPRRRKGARTAPLPTTKYGFPLTDWLAAKKEARSEMVERSKLQSTMTYTDLVESIRSITLRADDHRLRFLLEEVSIDEDKAGRGLISAVVVHSGGDRKPGKGFFDMAARRGRDLSDREACWIDELAFVHRQWSK